MAATEDCVFLGDACAFADSVYSVGTGLAVAQAVRLAAQLHQRPWSAESAAAWHTDAEATFQRSRRACQFGYDGQLLHDANAAHEVQRDFLG